jgi:hypothetical protein
MDEIQTQKYKLKLNIFNEFYMYNDDAPSKFICNGFLEFEFSDELSEEDYDELINSKLDINYCKYFYSIRMNLFLCKIFFNESKINFGKIPIFTLGHLKGLAYPLKTIHVRSRLNKIKNIYFTCEYLNNYKKTNILSNFYYCGEPNHDNIYYSSESYANQLGIILYFYNKFDIYTINKISLKFNNETIVDNINFVIKDNFVCVLFGNIHTLEELNKIRKSKMKFVPLIIPKMLKKNSLLELFLHDENENIIRYDKCDICYFNIY